jgi:hypothetical protein
MKTLLLIAIIAVSLAAESKGKVVKTDLGNKKAAIYKIVTSDSNYRLIVKEQSGTYSQLTGLNELSYVTKTKSGFLTVDALHIINDSTIFITW